METRDVIEVTQHKENVTINKEPKIITWSHILDQDMLDELRMVALCLAEAATTHFRTSWQMRAYADAVKGQHGASNEREEQFRNWYPPLDKNTAISKNTTITDDEGKIIAWLLPDLLSKRMQLICDKGSCNQQDWASIICTAAKQISQVNVLANQPQFFMNPKMGIRFPPGAINLSPAWHSRPRMLSEREDLREFIAPWGFTFNAVSVISNRSSPAHRDGRSGGAQYSDVLVSLGGDAGTVLELYSLGIRGSVSPGIHDLRYFVQLDWVHQIG
ncbi:hypothetical protein BC826DRAFT_976659 [Russula brevipes]|nr:hypothetical protein BC826DRAFT_976659 [Russula brevipes]